MRHFIKIIIIFIFLSCSHESIHLNIDENVQVYFIDNNDYSEYYGYNILKYKIQYKLIDDFDDYYINPDLYLKTYDAGTIENGKLTLIYSEIDETICKDIWETLVRAKSINISNNNAKIKIIRAEDIAATSIVLDAILLTDDEHLLSLSLPNLKTQSIF
jgi:hypothetical protein